MDPRPSQRIGIVGGTGAQGRALGARWALAGHPVHLGSRTRAKGEAAAQRVGDHLTAHSDAVPETAAVPGEVTGGTNAEAVAAADVVVVSLPFQAQPDLLPPLAEQVADKVVINVVNPMTFVDGQPTAVRVEEGSAAEQCQHLWPAARVVSAFHDVSSKRLWRLEEPVVTHVLICGDDTEAAHQVAHLAARIEGMWGVYCGPLRSSEYIENVTPVLLFINRYYRIQAGLIIDGIARDEAALHAHREADPAS